MQPRSNWRKTALVPATSTMENQPDLTHLIAKLGITALNPMQEAMHDAVREHREVVLLSPTGSGKTLAFLLPLIARLKHDESRLQALILVPSRELAIQIEQVFRKLGSGFKVNAVYGGRGLSHDKIDLRTPPAVLIGTPGRLEDHFRNERVSPEAVHTVVFDEYDKSLEVGFEVDMTAIVGALSAVERYILTSATRRDELPAFLQLNAPFELNFLEAKSNDLKIVSVSSNDADVTQALMQLLMHLGDQPGIVFCNFRESVETLSELLNDARIRHACFYGTMEQSDRELALVKFRNGSHNLLLATDLAARGLDVPEIQFIVHFELPMKPEEFTHRNGRTARMKAEGSAYVLHFKKKKLPPFVAAAVEEYVLAEELHPTQIKPRTHWDTLLIGGGRRDKISKGDLAGLFMKQGRLNADELGLIEVKQELAFVAVRADRVKAVLPLVDNAKVKTKKIRVRRV
jgi:superfamily II DNA/RNA helicase